MRQIIQQLSVLSFLAFVVTNGSGQTTWRYQAGPTAETAQVQGRVEAGGVSKLSELTLRACTR